MKEGTTDQPYNSLRSQEAAIRFIERMKLREKGVMLSGDYPEKDADEDYYAKVNTFDSDCADFADTIARDTKTIWSVFVHEGQLIVQFI